MRHALGLALLLSLTACGVPESGLVAPLAAPTVVAPAQSPTARAPNDAGPAITTYHTVPVDGVPIFYRAAGRPGAPTLVLLHGFPSSSHMFRDLIPKLSDRYRVIAPDYPGFGNSGTPARGAYAYTFDQLARTMDALLTQLGVNRYSLYIQDYGAPVGLRLASAHPERVQAIVSQNGNAYLEGLTPFWDQFKPFWQTRTPATEAPLLPLFSRPTTVFQYSEGYARPERISPDAVNSDQDTLDRPGNNGIQLDLFFDYQDNLRRYPEWHAYFRRHQPPLLAVWGKHDPIFGPAGAEAFRRDLPRAEVHLLNTGHFALEDSADEIAQLMRRFLARHVR